MNYQLHFSERRKTIALQIKQGGLIVRAPTYLTTQQVEQFVLSKKAWVSQKLALIQENKAAELSYQDGDSLLVFGQKKQLTLLTGENQSVCLLADNLVVTLTAQQQGDAKSAVVRKLLVNWFNQQVDRYLQKKLPYYEKIVGLNSTNVKIRYYKSRWGSCNNKGQLTFNSLLAMVPTTVFDYVIVHELCHLKHMNHSAAFWQLVASYTPDYQKQKQWLKINQKQIFLP